VNGAIVHQAADRQVRKRDRVRKQERRLVGQRARLLRLASDVHLEQHVLHHTRRAAAASRASASRIESSE